MNARFAGLLIALLGLAPIPGNTVVVGDLDWRQVTATTGLSWDAVSSVCNSTTGYCAGSIDGANFDGWTWASNSDIRALFDQLIYPGTTQFPTNTSAFLDYDVPGADAAIDPTVFLPTTTLGNYFKAVIGWSRSTYPGFPDVAYVPYLQHDVNTAMKSDGGVLGVGYGTSTMAPYIGVWLYRAVPEPGSAWLMLLGLSGLILARRTTARRRAP